jgi:hypothetical protein
MSVIVVEMLSMRSVKVAFLLKVLNKAETEGLVGRPFLRNDAPAITVAKRNISGSPRSSHIVLITWKPQ